MIFQTLSHYKTQSRLCVIFREERKYSLILLFIDPAPTNHVFPNLGARVRMWCLVLLLRRLGCISYGMHSSSRGKRKCWRVQEQQIGFSLKWLNCFLFSFAASFPHCCKINGFGEKTGHQERAES